MRWMTVLIYELGDRHFPEGLWVDVESSASDRWLVSVRDLPLIGIGETPAKAWEDLERHYWVMERWIHIGKPCVPRLDEEETVEATSAPRILKKVLKLREDD